MSIKPYLSDVTDEEWAFVAPYLTLMKEDALQRDHNMREVFNGVRYVVRTGCPWRSMPHDLPPWESSVSTISTLDRCWCLREHGSRLARLVAIGKRKKRNNQVRRFSMVERCNQHPKAVGAPVMMGINVKRAAKFISQSILWAIY